MPNPQPAAMHVRNSAVDVYRGFVMLLMLGEVLEFPTIAKSFPTSWFWRVLAYNQTHVEWVGMSLHDMIQPSFTFLVGVALPYSLASRKSKGQSSGQLLAHTLWRSLLLVSLGIFIRSIHFQQTYFTFEDTLTQIGLGYTFAVLIAQARPRFQWLALAVILFCYWFAWAMYPLPGPGFDWASVGVPPTWQPNLLHGFPAHWNKNANLGQAFDLRFLNLLPREQPFLYNAGGYLTLSFIPTLGTMLLGLQAGRWFREAAPRLPISKFLIAAGALMGLALAVHFSGICPIVKRIWTPAWTLWSGGVCFLFLAAFTWIIDARGNRQLGFPLIVIGMNSIAVYLMSWICQDFIQSSLRIHLGRSVLPIFGPAFEPLVLGVLTLAVYWIILFWMYRRKLFIRI